MKYKDRKEKTLKVLEILNKTSLNFKLKDTNTSQINIYLNNNQLIVYYAMKKTMYYKSNSKEQVLRNTFYDLKYENVGIDDVIIFANEKGIKNEKL